MPQHSVARSVVRAAALAPRDRWRHHHRNEVTEIIPLDRFLGGSADLDHLDFDDLDDLDFDHPDFAEFADFEADGPFDTEAQLLLAPELDDLTDTDDLTPALLAAPSAPTDQHESVGEPGTDQDPDQDLAAVPRSGGQHRKQPTSAAKGRLLISAMAAGAAAAAAHTATSQSDTPRSETAPAVTASALKGGAGSSAPRGAQVIAAQPTENVAVHKAEFARGVAFAQERAQREARLQQPLYVMPTKGIFTSAFGYRWGVLHGGIDLANSIGTPIYAVSDGVVIDAGPTAGYGAWVKVLHADGTVTLYGHVNSTLVNVGQRVMAGDEIATMGNRGFSTGPHLHFEVLLGGTQRIDPVPWLAKRGLHVGGYTG
ncbi:M23 family metallopeptidase [Mycobacterium spongiae]|uniref:M23 family metallopeptidase n=1 Tax=Mycobacterium spongiae TaxID=886343 RepID=UPI003CCEB170